MKEEEERIDDDDDDDRRISQLVSWCFEPSQPQRITLTGGREEDNNNNVEVERTHKRAYALDPTKCGNLYQGNELTYSSSENACSQSSQLSEPLWTDSGQKSGIGARKQTSTLIKRKKNWRDSSNLPSKILACEETATTTPTPPERERARESRKMQKINNE